MSVKLNWNQTLEKINSDFVISEDEIKECKRIASTLSLQCYKLLNSLEWKKDKITSDGDVISHLHLPESNKKIFSITAIINLSALTLIDFLYDNIESMPAWNKHVEESNRLAMIDNNTDIVYQAAQSYGNGLISARDFILLRRREQYESYHICNNVSVKLNSLLSRKNYIRGENGIGCFAARSWSDNDDKCQLTWILDVKLNGWIPQKIVELSVSKGMTDFMNALRNRVSKM